MPNQTLRRSAAEILAYAVTELFPKAVLLAGGTTELGFYYDIYLEQPLNEEFLALLEEKMRVVTKENIPIKTMHMMRVNAVTFLQHHKQHALAERIKESPDNVVDLFQMGDFYGFCEAPHLESSNDLKAFKLLSATSNEEHFWRISGTAFPHNQALKEFLKRYQGAKKRDHQRLGEELDLFQKIEGEWFWHPKGVALRNVLTDWVEKDPYVKGFKQVVTPAREDSHKLLFQRRFSTPVGLIESRQISALEDEELGLFALPSYTSLEATIFCTAEQLHKQLISSLQFLMRTAKILTSEWRAVLCVQGTRTHAEKLAIAWLKAAAKECDFSYEEEPLTRSCGPCIEVQIRDAMGRFWPGPSVAVKEAGVVKHQLLGPLERLVALLIEQHAGVFPLWLAPEQLRVIPVLEENRAFAEKVVARCRESGFRAIIDDCQETLTVKVHAFERDKVPYAVIVGKKEEQDEKVSIRPGNSRMELSKFLQQLKMELKENT